MPLNRTGHESVLEVIELGEQLVLTVRGSVIAIFNTASPPR